MNAVNNQIHRTLKELKDYYAVEKISKADYVFLYLLALNDIWPTNHWLQKATIVNSAPNNVEKSISIQSARTLINFNWPKWVKSADSLAFVANNCRIKKETDLAIQGLRLLYKMPEVALLVDSIPSPSEVLSLQTQGKRCISLLTELDYFTHLFDHNRNLRDFVIHDLEHLWKLAGDPGLYLLQVAWSKALYYHITQGDLSFLKLNPSTLVELNYLMSDMNTHPRHSWATLESLLYRSPDHLKPHDFPALIARMDKTLGSGFELKNDLQ